jgi:hypothetical protein
VDAGKNFPWDGIGFAGEVVGGAGESTRSAEPDDFVAAARIRDAGNVEESHIHGDATKDGAEATLDQCVTPIGKGAGQTVGVADGDGSDAKIAGGAEGCAVANGFATGDGADEEDAGFPGKNGLERRGGAIGGVDPVKGEAGAGVGRRKEIGLENGGGVGPVVGQVLG